MYIVCILATSTYLLYYTIILENKSEARYIFY